MIWYYTNEEGNQAGPVGETEFTAAVRSGVIHADTLVWKEGFPQWVKYSEVGKSEVGGNIAPALSGTCSECGRVYPQDEMINLEGASICAQCKPLYVQKLREGAPIISKAGFWRSGKRLVMPVDAALPERCVKCNEPTGDKQVKRNLYWHPPAVYLALILNVLIYVIVAMCCRKRATTFVSICPKHRSARRTVIILSWLLLLGGVAVFVSGVAQNSVWAASLGGVMFLGAIIYGYARGRLVYATKINKEHVWLGGCKPVFLAEFPEWPGGK